MKKATLKPYLITLLVLLLCFALMLTAFACSKTQKATETEETETTSDYESLVSNGDFSSHSGDTQPYKPTGWSEYTPSGYSSDNKVAGVVDTGADYQKNSSAWGNAANPFGKVTEENVLMVYNKEPNAFGYTSTFTAEPTIRYYSVQAKIKVASEEGGGATFWISSDNGIYQFKDITATTEFTTYTFYLLATSVKSNTITVGLSLGYAGDHVKGYAFFDDILVKTVTEKEYNDAEESSTVKCVSMLYPDGEFNYYDYSSSDTTLHTPSAWKVANGNTSDDDHTMKKVGGKALSTSDITSGIISIDNWDVTKYGATPELAVENSEDKNVLLLASPKTEDAAYSPTAFYYYSKNKVRIELATLYTISVWVNCTVDYDSTAEKGARVVLKGADEYVSEPINTQGEWVEVIFYVFGNQYHDKDFEIQLWFGNDENSKGLMQGKVMFDKLTITKGVTFTEAERNGLMAPKKDQADINRNVKVVDLLSREDNLVTNNNFETGFAEDGTLLGYEFSAAEDVKVKDDVIVKIISKAELDAEEWTDAYGIENNPKYPFSLAPVLIINNTIPCAYQMKTVNPENEDKCYVIEQSQYYRLSVWLKTVDMKDNITLKLVDESDSEIDSFTVNTKDYTNTFTNDYVEYTFYLKGAGPVLANSTDNDHLVRLMLAIGSGSNYDPSSFVKGAVLVANINMEKISPTEYSSAETGTYAKKHDYASNDTTINNGNFNSYDQKSTEIGDDGFVALVDKDGNDHLVAGVANWTNNVDNRYGTTKSDSSEEEKATYTLTKNDPTLKDASELVGKTVTTIKATSTSGLDKTFESDSEWNKVFTINPFTNKISWATSTETKQGTIEKTKENNDKNYVTLNIDLTGKIIDKITMTGPSDFKKIWKAESEWENYIKKDPASNKWYWVDNDTVTALAEGSYDVTVTLLTWSTYSSNKNLTLIKGQAEGDNKFEIDLTNRKILKVAISGVNSFSKTLTTEAEIAKYLTFNAEEKTATWANSEEVAALTDGTYTFTIDTDYKDGTYTVTVYYDQKETNNLIAGIINVNASADYLAQFNLTKESIFDNWGDVSEDVTLKSVEFGAPNLLMITTRGEATVSLNNTTDGDDTTNDMSKTPALKSETVSLSANSYYLLKCYAKAIGSAVGEVYVTTTATDVPLKQHLVKNTDGWVEYNFLVETGLTSVSAAFELYYGEKGSTETYSGTLLFDSFSYKSLTEDEYNKLLESANADKYKNQKFTTVTFNSDKAKDTAVSPSGFSAKNSTYSNSDTQVSGVIAKDNFAYQGTDGKNKLGIYETVTETDEDGKETSKDVLKEGSSLTKEQIFDSTGMEEGVTTDDFLLMINNRKATYQSYYVSSLSLETDSYYRFSAYVRTAFIEKDLFARVYVLVSDEPIAFKVNTEYNAEGEAVDNEWKKLNFYFKNEKSGSQTVSLYFELGQNDDANKMKGYLFVDYVSLAKIEEGEFNDAVYEKDEEGNFKKDENDKMILLSESDENFKLSNIVTILEATEEESTDDDTTETNKEKTKLDTTLLWTYITSIVIAVILIAVIVVLLIRKYRRPKNGGEFDGKKASYDKTNKKNAVSEESKTKTGSARDEYKD